MENETQRRWWKYPSLFLLARSFFGGCKRGATTFSVMILGIITLSLRLTITTLRIMTLGIMTFSLRISITTLSIIIFSITTFSIMALSIKMTEHNDT
jgi:hypothetical protein